MATKKNPEVVWHDGHVTSEDRQKLLGQKATTLWLTGLSASGKSTLAYALERELVGMGVASYVLDGDNVRHRLNRDLGFSASDRTENIRRVAEVARLMNDAGLVVITAFISPFRVDRAMAREIIGPDCFREIHVATPLAVCESRDPKGLYKKARNGLVQEFTGISAPYEIPFNPDLTLNTGDLAVKESLVHLLDVVACHSKNF